MDSQPSGNVTIVPTSADKTKVTVALPGGTTTKSLVFNTWTWNVAQVVTVTAKAAASAVNITHVITGDDTDYIALSDPTIAVTVYDSATAGVVISNTKFKITEGGTGSFTIVLSKQPDSGVIVTTSVPVANSAHISVSPATATFDAGTWNMPQTIMIMALLDADADDPGEITLPLTVAGYAGVTTVADVVVTIKDSDTRGAIISTRGLSINEGSKGTYTVKLKSRPSADVVIDVAASPAANVKLTHIPVTKSPSTEEVVLTQLTFTNATWNTAQTVIVEGISDASATDDIVTITHTLSANAGGYTTVNEKFDSVEVTVVDTDTILAGITVSNVSSNTLNISEGDSASYTIVLDSQPSENVTITPSSDTSDIVTTSSASIVFTTDNWFNERTVEVSATDNDIDAVVETKSAIIRHAITGADEYRSESIENIAVTVNDDDIAGITFSKSAIRLKEPPASSPSTAETAAATTTYTIVLDSKPLGSVTIKPISSGSSVTVSGELTFTSANWSNTQDITVTAMVDRNVVRDEVTISYTIKGGYLDAVEDTVEIVIIDNSASPGGDVTFSTIAVNVSEVGANTYTVVLDSKPTGSVTITPSSADINRATVSGELVFTEANWNIEQFVTITGVKDDNADNDEVNITHTISGGGYENSDLANVIATITDDDEAGVTVSTASLGVVVGNIASYTVVLDSKPSGNVTITPTLTTDADNYIDISPASYTFTPDNWNTPRTFEATGLAKSSDENDDDDKEIKHEITGDDAVYKSVSVRGNPEKNPVIEFAVYDADAEGLTLSNLSLSITEGYSKTYTIALSKKPSKDVLIKPTPPVSGAAGAGVITVSTSSSDNLLTFTTLNWNRGQTVTVVGIDDSDSTDNETATIEHIVTGDDVAYSTSVKLSIKWRISRSCFLNFTR